MKIITINLPAPHVTALQMLQDLGLYPSRSEAIRVAMRDFIQKHFGVSVPRDAPNAPGAPDFVSTTFLSPEDMKKEISRLLRKIDEEAGMA